MVAFKYLKPVLGLIFYLLWCHTVSMAQTPSTPPTQERSGRITWIERPWSTRYFIHLDSESGWESLKRVVTRRESQRVGKSAVRKSFDWENLFEVNHLVKTNAPDLFGNPNLAVVLVSFDEQGMVTSPHSGDKPLRGRVNQLRYLGLSDGEGSGDRFYRMAGWFTGLGDASTEWAPAFCNIYQMPDAATIKSDDYLYGKLFKSNGERPLFGCREWAYQLYDSDRPYIDVTSYEFTAKGKPPKGYIREFIGWARFGDSKPIIGLHEGGWYCLHDCPRGDKPGLIPDIKLWAKRFDWAGPMPPTKVPTFPDPPAQAGTYPYRKKPLTAPSLQ